MLGFVARRLLYLLPVLLAVSLLTFLIASLLPGDLAYVILGDQATPDKVAALRRKGIGPPGWTPHWLRHSHATALLLAGTPEWVVSRRLGHAHVQTTLDLYGWVGEDEALRAAANWTTYTTGWRVPDGR